MAILKLSDIAFFAAFLLLLHRLFFRKGKVARTPLRGPPAPSWLWGWSPFILASRDMASTHESWAVKYGPAYEIRLALGRKRVVLHDPLAVFAFYSRTADVYIRTESSKVILANVMGKGIIWSDGEDHKRQRKILTPAFSHQSIRPLTSVYYDSAYKTKSSWDALFEASIDNDLIIDIQMWMNRISLDTIGIAGFDHDFEALAGVHTPVSEVFKSSAARSRSPFGTSLILTMLIQRFPALLRLPIKRRNNMLKMQRIIGEIGDQLLKRHRVDFERESVQRDRSLIGTLVHAEKADSINAMSEEEVKAQMKALIFAGYETSSIVLTWLLLELGRLPAIQDKLRAELSLYSSDLTFDQLWSTSAAPYLDAVVKETLRLHPPVTDSFRVCGKDDVLPLSSPVTTRNGAKQDTLTITAGTMLQVPISALNRSCLIWGDDALEFKPERWLNDEAGLTTTARNMQGYHHLLTFLDGPRTCLGRTFAVTEIKAVAAVLAKKFKFAPRDGDDTRYDIQRGLLPRPKLEGEPAGVFPMRVQRVE